MIPAPRIWIYAPTPTTVEVLVLGPPEVIAPHVAAIAGALASYTGLENMQALGLGVHAMLFHAHRSSAAEDSDPIVVAMDALRFELSAKHHAWLIGWLQPDNRGMVATW